MIEQTQSLSGVRVLDLSRWIAGPHCALMLGDMGADVVKVETPGGDPSRDSGSLRSRGIDVLHGVEAQ